MIEAMTAGLILVSFVAFLATTSFSAPPVDHTILAYRALHELDAQGQLKTAAVAGDYQAITNLVSIPSLNHTVEICTRSSCSGVQPDAPNIWVGTYFIAGEGTYNPREVKLYVFE